MQKIKDMAKIGALFDLDGVLIDSEPLYTEFWSGMDREYQSGIDDFAASIKGTTLTHILSFFPSEVRGDITCRLHEYEDTIHYPVYPGVMEFLAHLRQENIPTAIVTSSDDIKMESLYKQYPGFDRLFDAVITASQITHSKPNPEGYLLAAKSIGCDPRDCFVFEDSLQGLEAGRRAGAKVVALATTNPIDVITPLADIVIGGFAGIDIDTLKDVIS